MYWADERLGAERLPLAYSYQSLLIIHGWMPLGTDFPIEKVSPLLTFFAAVYRRDTKNYPEGGFQIKNALTTEQALRGITIWAAKASFEEDKKGSIEVGKWADFVVLSNDIMKVEPMQVPTTEVLKTIVAGKLVYSK
jgi:predicted amidohydrolase YtcJ